MQPKRSEERHLMRNEPRLNEVFPAHLYCRPQGEAQAQVSIAKPA